MKDIRFSFSDPIYNFTTIVIVTQDMKRWDEKYPNPSPSTVEDDSHALYIRLKGKRGLIIIKPDSPLDDLQHEIGHAAREVMAHIGFKIHAENDEPLAYYEGYLTKRIHAAINKLVPSLTKRRKRA